MNRYPWEHCFVESTATLLELVVDLEAGTLVDIQRRGRSLNAVERAEAEAGLRSNLELDPAVFGDDLLVGCLRHTLARPQIPCESGDRAVGAGTTRFIVNVREVHVQPVAVDARSPQDAIDRVRQGAGDYDQYPGEYSHTLNTDTWTVEKAAT
ncbi:MAG: hypothetical protein ABSH20_03715 [Tepidisphaeraceae bacterium]|jgi:hypothetical protein